MSEITFEGEDSPELKQSMDDATAILTSVPDVKAVVIMVFSDEEPFGAVSLAATGLLPSEKKLVKILESLLTQRKVTG